MWCRAGSHLRVHGQRVQFVLLVGLGFAIKVPGYFGNRAALDSGRDPDGVASTDAQQVVDHYIDADGRRNCRVGAQKLVATENVVGK